MHAGKRISCMRALRLLACPFGIQRLILRGYRMSKLGWWVYKEDRWQVGNLGLNIRHTASFSRTSICQLSQLVGVVAKEGVGVLMEEEVVVEVVGAVAVVVAVVMQMSAISAGSLVTGKINVQSLGNNKPNTQQSSPAAGSSKLAGSANSFTPSAAPSPPYNSEVYTNFLSIEKLPSKVYVYEITFVKETDADGDPVLITRKFEKKGLFENDLKQRHAYVRLSTASVNFWVTDYTNIWSTRPLFDNDNETFVPPPVTNLTGINPYTRRTVTAESASIHFDRAIDCQQTLEHDPGNTTGNDVSAKLLERGLNAMFTAQAQRTAQQTPTNANPALKQVGANRFYKTEEAAKFDLDNSEQVKGFLGYFIPVRPGAQQYFLSSPFVARLSWSGAYRWTTSLRTFEAVRPKRRRCSKVSEFSFNDQVIFVIITCLGVLNSLPVSRIR